MSRAGPPKYDPLRRYLAAQVVDQVTLTFAEIEAILGTPLPASAGRVGWWANVRRARQAQAWAGAGWRRTWCDPWRGVVRFERRGGES